MWKISLDGLLFCLFLLLFSPTPLLFANNVTVANVELVDQDTSADSVGIEFDLTWSNAWKDSTNNDAVWAFAKYCTSDCTTTGTWSHATLKTAGTNPTGFADGTRNSGAFTALDIIVPADKKGAFIQPANVGSGTVDFTNTILVWDYGQDGVSDADATGADTYVRVFAIEMIYVPEAGFYAGDNSAGAEGQLEYFSTQAGVIDSESNMVFDATVATDTAWYYNDGGSSGEFSTGSDFVVSESFPKGFQASYVMKYEISQGQYRDFLNTLSQAEQNRRVESDLSDENDANTYVMVAEGQGTVVSRQTLKAGANPSDGDPYAFTCDLDDDNTGDESDDGEWIAMNYLSWSDLCAYADWAALRPMTELEFEKITRGTNYPITDEYVWGTTSLTAATSITNGGQASETAGQTGNGLVCYNNAGGVQGPLRVGFAATASTTTRPAAGAGYYGAMELDGNVWERAVTIGNADGLNFSGTHGDGVLTTAASYEGNATNPDWPGISATASQGVTGADGSGFRGSAWDETTADYLWVSNREQAALTDATRRNDSGGRVVRTAP